MRISYLCLKEVSSSDVMEMTYDLVLEETGVFVELAVGCIVAITIDVLPSRETTWKQRQAR